MTEPAAHHEADVFSIDRFLHASEGRLTSGISPASLMLAYLDWAVHLANSPGKQGQLVEKALRKGLRYGTHLTHCLSGQGTEPCIDPLPQDHRFAAPEWQRMPFAAWYQGFLLVQQWWHNAAKGVAGVTPHHEDVVTFTARQLLDMFSPSNFPATNPEILRATLESRGGNLVQGARNFLDDWERAMLQKPPVGAENFQVGRDVAVTPGKVVFRNRLIELIQYTPTTKTVHPEPILIVPAWIMKYYILDLSPANSMVKYLVDQGHTVFMISWRNPTAEDRDLGMDAYLELGVLQALDAVRAICGEQPVHAVGYCIGGTLLSIAAAMLGHNRRDWLKTITLFAAQTDFTEAGELMLFIDQSQVAYLEDIMWDQGYLDTKQMAGAFQLLRSNDLVWSRMVHDYLMGARRPINDLMAWNADATRMPYRMHSEYLRRLFLDNDLAEGRYKVAGKPLALTDIHAPMFVVGAERDHVAPWKSVYKINLLADTEVTFVLTSGGHNAGIVSEPGHEHRHHRVAIRHEGDSYLAPDEWAEAAETRDGSWWPTWEAWLAAHSGAKAPPPAPVKIPGAPAKPCPAPGTYVLED